MQGCNSVNKNLWWISFHFFFFLYIKKSILLNQAQKRNNPFVVLVVQSYLRTSLTSNRDMRSQMILRSPQNPLFSFTRQAVANNFAEPRVATGVIVKRSIQTARTPRAPVAWTFLGRNLVNGARLYIRRTMPWKSFVGQRPAASRHLLSLQNNQLGWKNGRGKNASGILPRKH